MGHAAQKQEMNAKFRSENLKDSHFEYLEVYGRKNTKTDHTEIWRDYVYWINLAQDSDKWRAIVNTVINIQAPQNTGNLTSWRIIKRYTEGVEVQLHPFLTLALDRDQWLNSSPGHFTRGNERRYLFNRRLSGPQRRSGRFGEDKNLLPLQGFEPRTVQPATTVLWLVRSGTISVSKRIILDGISCLGI